METLTVSQILDQRKQTNAPAPQVNNAIGKNALSDLSSKYDNFLHLLTMQLKNQDPLSPMDTSSVEQMIQSNQRLDKLIGLQSSTNAYAAASFLGTEVAVDTDRVMLRDHKARFDYVLGANASKAMLKIMDRNGQVVMIKEADRTVGAHQALWDGTDFFGNQLPDGEYSVSVSYEDAQGKTLSAQIVSYGLVDSAELIDGEVFLNMGAVRVSLDKILKLTRPTG
jgi:flagellar basal-body rod modification protein FlgD